ncbi:epidermal growth factor receptor substrate 15 isoform A [Daubentonia madagascariensis]|uniref:Epidermal growth factor receptor substrate 15 isoform A n=1 Tax=Daubentonia madagascariensis TaxID=31869 RepID=A0ABD2E0X1_DAUMA
MAAAAQLSLTQLSSGNPVYEKYYRQVDAGNTGRVLASEAATFLKKSGLPDLILGKIWDLADTDGKGILNKQAMFLVYRALEKEPVPMSLPPALVPPSKRKTWVVSPAEKAKYDEIFLKTDKDMDGFVSGLEVREIFLKTGLPSALLAHIWALCDTKDCGKLSKDQFALAFHLINQKLIKGIDPPHILTPEMIPPSDRASLQKNIIGSSPVADFSAIKELDTLNNEIVDLQREKNNVEQDLKEKEDTIKQRTSEVQISCLKAELTSQESQISTYEEELAKAREELSRLQQETAELEESVESGKAQLEPLQQHLQDSQQEISSARSSPEIPPSAVTEENEVLTIAVNEEVCPEFDNDRHSKEEDPFNVDSSSLTDPVADTNLDFFQSDPFVGNPFGGDPFKGSDPFASDCFFRQSSTDPFATSSTDPFSAANNSSNTSVEILKHNDPFAPGGTVVVAASDSATDPFASVFGNESFGDGFADFSTLSKVNNEDDPFSSATLSSVSSVVITKNVFEETSVKSEEVPPALPPKIGTPTRPCPPPPGKRPINKLDSSDPFKLNDPFQPFPGSDSPKEKDPDMFCDPFTSTTTTINKEADPSNFANFSAYPSEEDMIEWAKRESEREEEQRLARLNQQEQEDLELAIALSKSEISEA